ncbi:MAG TPA: Imm50 family immunity protein [Candidatus Binatia bacterium]|jgi:hypothetical protein
MKHDYAAIEGIEKLEAVYGDALCFHDSEVVRVELIRGRSNEGEASLVLSIHLFAVEGVDHGVYRFGRHNVATFQFDTIQEVQLEGFNHQNMLMDLSVAVLTPPQNGARYKVSLESGYGLGGTFNCYRIKLISVSAGIPPGSSYS